MEKLLYLLWQPDNKEKSLFEASKRTRLANNLLQAGASQLRFNLADQDVAAADAMRLTTQAPLPDAVLTFWLPSASQRTAAESLLMQHCSRLAGYSVCESEPLSAAESSPIAEGERQQGMNHIVFLQKPDHLAREEWLRIWLEEHTTVAIETQETFGYRQNIVVRALSEAAQLFDAIVEENFPAEAMADQNAFYRRETPEMLALNQQRMYQSCKRFIDFRRMSRLPTSQYEYD